MNGADASIAASAATDRRTVEPAKLGRGLVIAVERCRGQEQILGMNLRRRQRPDGRATSAEVRREQGGVETQIQMSRVSARDQLGQDRLQSHVERTQSAPACAASNSDGVFTIAGT